MPSIEVNEEVFFSKTELIGARSTVGIALVIVEVWVASSDFNSVPRAVTAVVMDVSVLVSPVSRALIDSADAVDEVWLSTRTLTSLMLSRTEPDCFSLAAAAVSTTVLTSLSSETAR